MAKFDPNFDPYEILGFKKDRKRSEITQDEITTAFKKLRNEFHPDKHFHKTEKMTPEAAREFLESCEAKFKGVYNAWETLNDPQKRAEFDRKTDSGFRQAEADAAGREKNEGTGANKTAGTGQSGTGNTQSGARQNQYSTGTSSGGNNSNYKTTFKEEILGEVKRARNAGTRPDLSKFIRWPSSWHDLDLSGQDLAGSDFKGGRIYSPSMRNVNFAKGDLSRVNLSHSSHADVNFSEANLNGANLEQSYFTGANFTGAELDNANMSHGTHWESNLSQVKSTKGTNFDHSSFSMDTKLDGAVFEDASMQHARFSLFKGNHKVHFKNTDLQHADFGFTKMAGSTFEGTNLTDAKIGYAGLENATLKNCDATGVDFSKAETKGMKFTEGTKLAGATFKMEQLHHIDLSGADHKGINIVDRLGKAMNVTLDEAGKIKKNWVETVTGMKGRGELYAGGGLMAAGIGMRVAAMETDYQHPDKNGIPSMRVNNKKLALAGNVTSLVGATLSVDNLLGSPMLRQLGHRGVQML